MMTAQKIILASGSAQRRALLAVLRFPFEVISAEIDEKAIRHADLKTQAALIARAKAEKVASEHEGIVIAADTFVGMGTAILEKPATKEEAAEMLRRQSGHEIEVYTGCCYIDRLHHLDFSTAVSTRIRFREMSNQEIEGYVRTCPVTDWSGAFSSAYPYGLTFVSHIEGSFTGFTHGLPMEVVIPLLKQSGYYLSLC